jgi:GMP synthase (glutamine-hydrolysing)
MTDRTDPPGGVRVLVLKTGTTFPATRRRFGDFDRWFLDALRGADATFDVRDVTAANPPPAEAYHGVIVTGSPAAVYRPAAWMTSLRAFLARATESQLTPVLAVCFAAQALAAALGGKVELCPGGWEIGTIEVRRTSAGVADRLLGGGNGEARFQATHQDWIASLPSEAVLLAGNEHSPVQAFRVGERVWGTQFHPEATPAILEDLIRTRREALIREGDAPAEGDRRYRARLAALAPTPAGPALVWRVLEVARTSPLPR